MEYDYIEVVDDSDIGDNISLTLEITLAKKNKLQSNVSRAEDRWRQYGALQDSLVCSY